MDARNRDLDQWLTRVSTGQLQLPRFQRFEAWGSREVADLVQTVIDGLPAGAVLVLEIGDHAPFVHRMLAGTAEPTERMTELLLDGQQRLTALWRALNGDYEDHTYFIDIRDIDADEDGNRDYRVWPQPRWWRDGRRYPLWCDDPRQVLKSSLIPLRLLLPSDEAAWKAWLSEATQQDVPRLLELHDIVSGLRERVAHFNLPFLALPVGSSAAVVLNVFVKLNTHSVPLTAFDIIVARVEGETGESLHDLVGSLEGQVPSLARYIAAKDLVLPVAALLQDRRPTQRELVFLDFERMVADWPKVVVGAQRLVELLEEEQIPDGIRLPSEIVLAPIAALWSEAPDSPDRLGAARTLLRRYLWRAFTTTRYEFAAASSSYQDYKALRTAILDGVGDGGAPIFDDAAYPLPPAEELLTVGWPRRRERLARAILCVSLRRGALDIADGARVSPDNVTKREYHHLYPLAFLAQQGIDERRASVALNCALITWRTNRTISAKPPVEYLRDRADAATLGEPEVRHRVESHVIDFDALAAGDFDFFLGRRAERMATAFRQLTSGGDWQ